MKQSERILEEEEENLSPKDIFEKVTNLSWLRMKQIDLIKKSYWILN